MITEGVLSIRSQLFLGIGFIIVLSVSATTFFLTRDAAGMLSNEIEEKAKLAVSYLQGVSADSVLSKDEVMLSTYIDKVSDTPGFSYVLLTDNNSVILATKDVTDLGKKIDVVYRGIINMNAPVVIQRENRQISAFNYFGDISAGLKNGRVKIGSIYVGIDTEYVKRRLAETYLLSGVIGIVILFLSIVYVFLFAGSITRPLNSLIDGTAKIADGDLKYKIKVNGKNEFQVLANSFNQMSDKLCEYYDGILSAFTIALDTKDKYTPGHSKRTARHAIMLAKAVNLKPRQIENIRIASILKDIGNIGVEGKILNKKDALSPDDFIKIQQHPEISAKIIANIPALKDVVPVILQHHERFDGQGYPKGLKGNEICIEAKILAIADAYDAMITRREHREALSKEEAIYELRYNKGKQFDPDLVENFVQILHKEGSL